MNVIKHLHPDTPCREPVPKILKNQQGAERQESVPCGAISLVRNPILKVCMAGDEAKGIRCLETAPHTHTASREGTDLIKAGEWGINGVERQLYGVYCANGHYIAGAYDEIPGRFA